MASPISQVLLRLDKAFQDEIVTESGIKFFFDGTWNKPFSATVTATIAALPTKPDPKDKHILDSLKVGDEVAISYKIAAELTFQGDGERFMKATEPNDYYKEFISGKGEKIVIVALPARRGLQKLIWAASLFSKYGDLLQGYQGTEDEVERWLSQFQFGNTDIYSFDNFFEFEGQDYWKCELTDIFAKKEKGHIKAVGDRIICKPIEEDVPDDIASQIQHNFSVKIRYQDRGKILSARNNAMFKRDEIIHFNPQYTEPYEFWGRPYILIKEKYVEGKWN